MRFCRSPHLFAIGPTTGSHNAVAPPEHSTATVEERGDGFGLRFPPQGTLALLSFPNLWTALISVVSLLFAWFFEQKAVTGGIAALCPPSPLWLLFSPVFLALAAGSNWLLYRLCQTRAELVVQRDRLRISATDLWGIFVADWPLEKISAIQCLAVGSTDGGAQKYQLAIAVSDEWVLGGVTDRDQRELERAAKLLNEVCARSQQIPFPHRRW